MIQPITRHAAVLTLSALALLTAAGCSPSSSTSADVQMAGLPLSAVAQSSNAQALNDLRRITASLHDVDAALASNYSLLIATPLTAPDGCISDMSAGGMGYHYSRFDNLGDNTIDLLNPEFLVYAPTGKPAKGGDQARRLGAVEYFIPYSPTWPGPTDAAYTRAPRLSDFSSFAGMPDVSMSPTRFGGWALHIWLWEHNPAGMLTNYNASVARCAGSSY